MNGELEGVQPTRSLRDLYRVNMVINNDFAFFVLQSCFSIGGKQSDISQTHSTHCNT